jgi:hypothetical protein
MKTKKLRDKKTPKRHPGNMHQSASPW